MSTWSTLCRDTLGTQPTTRRNFPERRCQAQLVPTNRGRMCTLTNENVIPMRCITTEAVNTNNVLILIFIFLSHGFLRDRCTIGRPYNRTCLPPPDPAGPESKKCPKLHRKFLPRKCFGYQR